MSYQNEDVLQTKGMEFFHHLWKVSESPGVEGEDSTLVRIVQIVPLYILTKQIKTYFVCLGCTDMTKQLLQISLFWTLNNEITMGNFALCIRCATCRVVFEVV